MTVPEIRARYVDRADTIFQLAPPEPAQVCCFSAHSRNHPAA